MRGRNRKGGADNDHLSDDADNYDPPVKSIPVVKTGDDDIVRTFNDDDDVFKMADDDDDIVKTGEDGVVETCDDIVKTGDDDVVKMGGNGVGETDNGKVVTTGDDDEVKTGDTEVVKWATTILHSLMEWTCRWKTNRLTRSQYRFWHPSMRKQIITATTW
jgi:hypothetical protein